ncbi:MAG: sulfite exporter TauE/SafE family protein [Pseudomonadota bacterium]
MITFDLTFFAFAIPAVIFSGASKGGFGSGASFASAAILAVIVPPEIALGMMLPLLMLIDVSSFPSYWRKWHWAECRRIIVGSVPGVALGALFFSVAPADLIRFLIGVVALAFVGWQVAKNRGLIPIPQTQLGAGAGLATGAVAGFTSFVSHAGGPPVAVYLLSQKFDKLTYQASTVLIFWAINVMKFVPYAFLGAFTMDTWWAFLILAPVAVLGTWIGVKAHRIVSERAFFAITYTLLVLTGSRLIWMAVT